MFYILTLSLLFYILTLSLLRYFAKLTVYARITWFRSEPFADKELRVDFSNGSINTSGQSDGHLQSVMLSVSLLCKPETT